MEAQLTLARIPKRAVAEIPTISHSLINCNGKGRMIQTICRRSARATRRRCELAPARKAGQFRASTECGLLRLIADAFADKARFGRPHLT